MLDLLQDRNNTHLLNQQHDAPLQAPEFRGDIRSILTQFDIQLPILDVQRESSCLIAWGGEAMIWKVELDGREVIARDIRPPESRNWATKNGARILLAIAREISLQSQVKHRNILPILGISTSELHPLSIITPLVPNGSAPEYLDLVSLLMRPAAMLRIVRAHGYGTRPSSKS
ncbi:hypothetical protein DL93DRAFT_1571358 [Clavulina sp. PMI_390]|nr:hypothetical protein DL93DRAFT_1571358 [Clavulina sp. PMI_390]